MRVMPHGRRAGEMKILTCVRLILRVVRACLRHGPEHGYPSDHPWTLRH